MERKWNEGGFWFLCFFSVRSEIVDGNSCSSGYGSNSKSNSNNNNCNNSGG